MEETKEFSKLEETVRFLDTPVYEDIPYFNNQRYRLNGQAEYVHNDENYELRFLGTGHPHVFTKREISEDKKSVINDFVNSLHHSGILLIEVGGYKAENTVESFVVNSIDKYGSKLDLNYQLFIDWSDMNYATSVAVANGMKVINMEACYDPSAIPELLEHLTPSIVIEEFGVDIEYCLKDDLDLKKLVSLRNQILRDLLKEYAPNILYELDRIIESPKYQKSIIPERETWLSVQNDIREAYMAGIIEQTAKVDRIVNFHAHTVHVEGILKILATKGEFSSFYARAELLQ